MTTNTEAGSAAEVLAAISKHGRDVVEATIDAGYKVSQIDGICYEYTENLADWAKERAEGLGYIDDESPLAGYIDWGRVGHDWANDWYHTHKCRDGSLILVDMRPRCPRDPDQGWMEYDKYGNQVNGEL